MSLDRRIVSILYHNGIEDVESVQQFIGEENGYFKVVINDEVRNLEIPGNLYVISEESTLKKELQDVINVVKSEIKEVIQEVKDKAVEIKEDLSENIQEIKKDFEEETQEVKEKVEEIVDTVKEEVSEKVEDLRDVFEEFKQKIGIEKIADSEEFIDVEEVKNKVETLEIKEEETEIKEKNKKPSKTKKLKIVESKKDDDFEDFINLA